MFKLLMSLFLALFTLSCSNTNDSQNVIEAYENDVTSLIIPNGTSKQIHIYERYSDGALVEITDSLVWSSSDESVATVEKGLVTALHVGVTTIHYETQELLNDGLPAKSEDFLFDIQELSLSAITLQPTQLTLSKNSQYQLSATPTFVDAEVENISLDYNWSSSNTTVATVTQEGLLTALSVGETEIIAAYGNVTSPPTALSVEETLYTSLSIQTPTTEFNVQQQLALEVFATTDKGETLLLSPQEVYITSSDSDIVSIDNVNSIATALTKGEVTLNATLLDVTNPLTATLTLNVLKDQYVRIFNENGEEVSLYDERIMSFDKNEETITSFTLKAVGANFIITDPIVTDFSLTLLPQNYFFWSFSNPQELLEEQNISFELRQDSADTANQEIRYSFMLSDGTIFVRFYKSN